MDKSLTEVPVKIEPLDDQSKPNATNVECVDTLVEALNDKRWTSILGIDQAVIPFFQPSQIYEKRRNFQIICDSFNKAFIVCSSSIIREYYISCDFFFIVKI